MAEWLSRLRTEMPAERDCTRYGHNYQDLPKTIKELLIPTAHTHTLVQGLRPGQGKAAPQLPEKHASRVTYQKMDVFPAMVISATCTHIVRCHNDMKL